MMQLDTTTKTLTPLDQSDLKGEKILERYDLQKSIINSWEKVRSYLGLSPQAYLIGSEIKPHDSVGDSIDLLAYDVEENSLYVIELKRSKDKLQLLQAISYAAMVATWDRDMLKQNIDRKINPDPVELIDEIDSIDKTESNMAVKIILLAESYDPEVILTANWLNTTYHMQITAFAVLLHKLENKILVHFEQRIPLRELRDTYEERTRTRAATSSTTWDEILSRVDYDFAEEALAWCRKITGNDGDSTYRRFSNIRTKTHGYDWITLYFRYRKIVINMGGKPDNAEKDLKKYFGDSLEVAPWRDGFSFSVKTDLQFKLLTKWLEPTSD